MKQWHEELFENYAETYDAEEFTKGTIGECDFIEKEINYDKTEKILALKPIPSLPFCNRFSCCRKKRECCFIQG